MHHLEALKRERLPILYNLMPEGLGEKYAGSYILRLETTKGLDKNMSPGKNSPFRGSFRNSKTLRRVMTTVKLKTQGQKISSSRTRLLEDAKEDDNDRAALLLATGRIGKPIPFNVNDYPTIALYDQGCVTCGKENIETKYHGMRHICPNCRNYLRTYENDKAYVYLSEDGNIVCKGVKMSKEDDGSFRKVIYDVLENELKIFEYRCYVTLSGPDELVVLLHDKQIIPRGDPNSLNSTKRSLQELKEEKTRTSIKLQKQASTASTFNFKGR